MYFQKGVEMKNPEESKCIIETKDGPVRGFIEVTEERTYYKFKSIPYATPPLGRLRFLVSIDIIYLRLINIWLTPK